MGSPDFDFLRNPNKSISLERRISGIDLSLVLRLLHSEIVTLTVKELAWYNLPERIKGELTVMKVAQSLDHFVVPVDDLVVPEEFYEKVFDGRNTRRNGLSVGERKRGAVRHTFIQIGGKRMGVYLQSVLNSIGYKATVKPISSNISFTYPQNTKNKVQINVQQWYQDYPAASDELEMLRVNVRHVDLERKVAPTDVAQVRDFVCAHIHVDDRIREYIVRLGRATRTPGEIGLPALAEVLTLGISPRSYQHILALARVSAFQHGREYVLPTDVKEIFCDAARHRIVRSVRAQAENISADVMLRELLAAVPIP